VEWRDEAIVLAKRPHGESGLIVQLLTREHGRHAGLVRGGQGRKVRGTYEIGNRLEAHWQARLAEHLGIVTGELLHSPAAILLDDAPRLLCLAAAAAVAEAALPERLPEPAAYAALLRLVAALEADDGWAVAYVLWELDLLASLGFGLGLARCVATGTTADLAYVSPKSGHAVSAAAGAPYRDRLLRLPPFLRPDVAPVPPMPAEVIDALHLAAFFLEERVLMPNGQKLPPARSRFVDALAQLVTISGRQSS
jgi:DNA repair protein RecO (recombination protein O)